MKKHYLLSIFALTTFFCTAQGYEFGIVHISNHDFKIVAIPDFDSSGNTDVSDIGFTLMLPTGADDIINEAGLLGGRPWTVQEFDAAFLTGLGLGDGTRDAFQFNLPPGQSIFSHTNGQVIDLVSFQVSNSPVTGELSILLNSDSIAIGAGGVLDSFYNSNIDATTTQDYFSGLVSGMDVFLFSTLGMDDPEMLNSISVFPNPTSDYLNIKSSITLEKISLYNIWGEKITDSYQTKKINMSQYSSGVYFLRIYNIEGKKLTKKIIKI